MHERFRLLEKLILEGHVNVTERQSLGVVGRVEVAEILKSFLLRDGAFPFPREGRAVYEGATITSLQSGAKITWERGYPWDPSRIADRRIELFTEIDSAVEAFIDSEWGAGIDGIMLARQT